MGLNSKQQTLYNKVKGLFFKGFQINVWEVLKRVSVEQECFRKSNFQAFLTMLFHLFFTRVNQYDMSINEKAKIIFVITDVSRKSSESNFLKVVSTVSDIADVIVLRKYRKQFCFVGGVSLLVNSLFSWWKTMNEGDFTFVEKCEIIRYLIDLHYFKTSMPDFEYNKYKLLVTYYDSLLYESFITLLFKKNKIATATLQHGQFTAWRENTIENSGIEFRSSNSDFFLCWNKMTQDEGMKSGLKKCSMPVLGIISNIGRGYKPCVCPHNNIFGVVLCHPSWEYENVKLIESANILASRIKMSFYLKLHPNYKEDYFDDIMDHKYYIGNIQKGVDILEYANSVDFSIIGSTSVVAELVYCSHPIILYSSKLASDKYRDVDYECKYSNPQEIIDVYKKMNNTDMNKLFGYLCCSYNTEERYRDFFLNSVL